MVVKIYPAAPSCSAAVNYNERKVAEGHASVIFSSSIADPRKPMDTFSVYENGSLRCQNRSFHASVNPGKNDHMTDEDIKAFVKDYMEKIGYGKQPYILYKHTDIERTHYHIVSVRVDENGNKISDSFERKRSREALEELAEKYDFKVGTGKEVKEVDEQDDYEKKGQEQKFEFNPYEGFDPGKGHISEQINALVELAKTYYFKEPQQFDYIMETLGVQVSRTEVDGKVIMGFRGLDPKTKEPCTPIVTLSNENSNLPEWIEQHVAECKKLIKNREKEKVDNLACYATRVSRSQKHFENLLKKQGIIVKISRNVDGKIFGVVFIDTKNKCVFKGSELPKFKVQELEEARKNRWYDEVKQKEKKPHETAVEVAEEVADLFISALGERSRHYLDEEIMRRGQKKPN